MGNDSILLAKQITKSLYLLLKGTKQASIDKNWVGVGGWEFIALLLFFKSISQKFYLIATMCLSLPWVL